MSARAVRRVVVVVFVLGIAGMIVGSIADNNGAALTAGLVSATAALCLMVATAVANDPTVTRPAPPVERAPGAGDGNGDGDPAERQAEELEARIGALVASGADETEVRDLVRAAVRLGRVRT